MSAVSYNDEDDEYGMLHVLILMKLQANLQESSQMTLIYFAVQHNVVPGNV